MTEFTILRDVGTGGSHTIVCNNIYNLPFKLSGST
jgi:hypothetical protein